MKDICAIRLLKDGVPLLGDMDFVQSLEIDKVDAELYYQINLQVEGMGGQYQRYIEVSPNDTIDAIRSKAPFFSLFTQRNYMLVTDGGNTIDRDQYGSLHFRDSGLRHGSRLFMRPPHRDRDENELGEESEEAEQDDEGQRFGGEGGEDEMVEMEGGEEEIEE